MAAVLVALLARLTVHPFSCPSHVPYHAPR